MGWHMHINLVLLSFHCPYPLPIYSFNYHGELTTIVSFDVDSRDKIKHQIATIAIKNCGQHRNYHQSYRGEGKFQYDFLGHSAASFSFSPRAHANGGGTAFPICLCLD